MSVQSQIYSVLNGVISAPVYYGKAPQDASIPFVVYNVVSVVPVNAKATGATAIVDDHRVQFDIFAATVDGCDTIEAEIRTLIDGYTDAASNILDIAFESKNPQAFNDKLNEHQVSCDYIIQEQK